MLKYIEEFGKYVTITGFRNAKIADLQEFLKNTRKKESNVEIQFFDAKYIATWQHLYFAVLNAFTAFRNNRCISKSLAMETMLYASTQRQIRKAMEILGIKSETSQIAVLIIGENSETVKSALSMISATARAQCNDKVLELSEEKRRIIQETFGISDSELKTVMKKDDLEEALTSLIVERMALTAIQR